MNDAVKSTGWMKVDPTKLDRSEKKSQKGVHFEMSFSPYDIPEEVRGYYCNIEHRFVIEFRYLSDEPLRESVQENIATFAGVNSGRIYKILVDVDSLGVDSVSVSMAKAVDEMPAVSGFNGRAAIRSEINRRLFDYANHEVVPAALA